MVLCNYELREHNTFSQENLLAKTLGSSGQESAWLLLEEGHQGLALGWSSAGLLVTGHSQGLLMPVISFL